MRVAIRVDSGTAIGAGHLTRCLTLADELRDRGADVDFITRTHPGHLAELARARDYQVHELTGAVAPTSDPATWLGTTQEADALDTLHASAAHHPLDWIIVDHYGLDATWHHAVRPAAVGILAIDDLADRPLAADLILDHNYDANTRAYHHLAPNAKLLLGSRYCLLPKSIRAAGTGVHRSAKPNDQATVLVSLGGSDPANATAAVLVALHDILATVHHVDVVIGSAHPAPDAVAERCRTLPNATLHVQTERMADLLIDADVAVGAGGTSTWERLFLGVPSIVLPLAPNQVPTLRALVAAGLVLTPAPDWRSGTALADQLSHLLDDRGHRERVARRGQGVIDGRGAERVTNALLERR